MADKKVSDLPSLNGADVDPADLLYIVDSSAGAAGSKKITVGQYQLAPVSGGTANTVVYLNGSKVESSSSALTFDGTNFATTGTSSAAKLIPTGGTATGNGMYLPAANTLAWSNNGAETMRLDASGNLGLGVTPSAWQANWRGLQVGGSAALWSSASGIAGTYLSNNNYFNGTNRVYILNGTAAEYAQLSTGAHVWYTAPSGTAGNAISFTQAMTLSGTSDVQLLLGTTTSAYSTAGRGLVEINGSSTALYALKIGNTAYGYLAASSSITELAANGASQPLVFTTNAAERARITSGGDLLVGTTSGAITVNGLKFFSDGSFYSVQNSGVTSSIYNKSNYTSGTDFFADFKLANTTVGSISANGSTTSYSTSSDRRLKENIAPAADAGAVIDAIEVIQHDWKAGGHTRYGVVAQDLNAVAPEAVTQGDDGDEIVRTWGVDYSKLVPMLIKEIQTLRARVAALEAK